MTSLTKVVHLLVTSLICCSTAQPASQLSLWGKTADLASLCSHWSLSPGVSVPNLQEFTVCLKFKLQTVGSTWTIFMYRHPDFQYTELGFGGRWSRLVVWLFGETWTTAFVNLERLVWYSMCLTWSDTKHKPTLYVNGNPINIMRANSFNASKSSWRSCCALAPNGTLTLGASHFLINGNIQILPSTRLFGQISLFRLWGHERSKQEVTSLYCTEGLVVKWTRDHWDTQRCEPVPDSSLNCEWSLYQVKVLIAIIRHEGNTTDLHTARNFTQNWLQDVLPANIELQSLTLVEVLRFDCLIDAEIVPGLDVAAMQRDVQRYLQAPYDDAESLLQIMVQSDSIQTTAVESFWLATDSPPTGTATNHHGSRYFAQISSYHHGKNNQDLDCGDSNSCSSYSGKNHQTHHHFHHPDIFHHHGHHNSTIHTSCSRESCVFQVQVMMSHAHTEEMEAQIRTLLMMPYDNGSISIATEDIQISRILSFMCGAESLKTLKGLFQWPATSGGKNCSQPCPKNHSLYATRHCQHELELVLDKLKDVVSAGVVSTDLGQTVINTISDILEKETDLLLFTNTILNLTQAVGDTMVGFEGSSSLVAPAIAVSVVDVDPVHFPGLTFGVSSDRTGSKPEIHINRSPLNGTVTFTSLPSVLRESFPEGPNKTRPRIQFQFYGIPLLFENNRKYQILNSYVVSASVTNATAPIKGLEEDIQITFRHLRSNQDVSRSGMDPATEQALTIISYIGCGFSALFLGITVLTYSAFEKLRRDYPSQILLNLSLSLLGLNLVFLLNSWLSSWGIHSLCVATAVTQHYFLLASIAWMGLEGINMYFALVKVFNVYVPSYMLKFCVLGWGLPLVVCVLVLVSHREAYGSYVDSSRHTNLRPLEDAEDFCWIQDDVTFYVSVVAYALIVFLVNIAVFIVVLIQIRQMQVNSPVGTKSGLLHDLKGVASLTILLGLTWTTGFFTFGPARVVLLYLFAALNTLQGASSATIRLDPQDTKNWYF
ncbi:adhesion G-protein coupled receptor G4-like [Neosynchiropus ocellatus]